ncbi:MAG: hypothetical protein WA125_03465 [Desulfosporosinus sp.]
MNEKTAKTFKAAFAALHAMEDAKDIQWIMSGFDRAFLELDISEEAEDKEKMLTLFNNSFNDAMGRVGKEEMKKALQKEELSKFYRE